LLNAVKNFKMLNIKIVDCSKNAFISRDSFNTYIRKIIGGYVSSPNDCQKTTIEFPINLTKQDRYFIHKLSVHNHLRSVSHDDDFGGRFIITTLSKNYVQELFIHYDVQKTEKQILFDTLILFVENNFQVEFQEYMNTI
jgi:hypothetical protein